MRLNDAVALKREILPLMLLKPWQRVVGSVALAIAAMLGSIATVATVVHHDRWQHAGQHGSFVLGTGVLLVCALLLWPEPRGRPESWFRRVLLLGLASILVGNLLEGAGAFGYALDDGYLVVNQSLSQVHDIGLIFGPIGILAFLAGSLGTLATMVWSRVTKGRLEET